MTYPPPPSHGGPPPGWAQQPPPPPGFPGPYATNPYGPPAAYPPPQYAPVPVHPVPQYVIVQQPAPTTQIIKTRRQTNHGLHMFLTIATCGLWLLVWPIVAATNSLGPRKKTTITYR